MNRRDFIQRGALWVLGAAVIEPYVRKWWPVGIDLHPKPYGRSILDDLAAEQAEIHRFNAALAQERRRQMVEWELSKIPWEDTTLGPAAVMRRVSAQSQDRARSVLLWR